MIREEFILGKNAWIPNNPLNPVLVYRGVESGDRAALLAGFERRFERNGWPPDWRDTVYDYHHFHSTAHEALGVASGRATLELGGPDGRAVEVAPGDAIILPAGTGHRCVRRSNDFVVVGAYPEGQTWDVCRDAPSAAARARIAGLPSPADPVLGLPALIRGATRRATSERGLAAYRPALIC